MNRLSTIRITVVAFLCSFLFACASTRPMVLKKTLTGIDIKTESIALFSLKMSNQYHPTYQPEVSWIKVDPNGGKWAIESFNKSEKNEFNEYLVSIQLLPGKYTITDVLGHSGIFPVMGTFQFPMNVEFELKPNTVAYIGNISMVNRRRNDDRERRSGSIFPLLDQAVTGFAGGTFDVSVNDEFEKGVADFKTSFPILNDQTIEKAIGKAVITKLPERSPAPTNTDN